MNSSESRRAQAASLREILAGEPLLRERMAEYLRAKLSKAQDDMEKMDGDVGVRRLQGECRALRQLIKDLVADAKAAPSS